MKKLFGGINLTWKKLILFSIIMGIYTAVMALLPITKDTSFRDIAIQLECWIVLGIIIICNSKSPLDSALKCFVFFLISQPLVYLIQVPFSELGFGLFGFYRTWFIWTLLTFPMGFIGYYIKKNNILSLIILLPMLLLLSYFGLGYLDSCIESFPHHLLSFIFCFVSIVIIVLCLFDKTIYKVITLVIVFIFTGGYIFFNSGFANNKYEVVRSLSEYNFSQDVHVSTYSGTKEGSVDLIPFEDSYNVKLSGKKYGKYIFELTDKDKVYSFEFYYDKDNNTVILKEKK